MTRDWCDRAEKMAAYMVENGATVRQCAAYFAVSKSTVHKDITEKLMGLNKPLYLSVKALLEKNKSERHLRGGEATRRKYHQKSLRFASNDMAEIDGNPNGEK